MEKIVFHAAKKRMWARFGIFILAVFGYCGLATLVFGQNMPRLQAFWLVSLPMIGLTIGLLALNARSPILPEDLSNVPEPVHDAVKIARQVGASIHRVDFEDSNTISLSRAHLSLPKKTLDETDVEKTRAGLTLAIVNSRYNLADRALEIAVLTASVLASLTRGLLADWPEPTQFWISISVACLGFFVPLVISVRLKPRMIARAIRLTGDEAAMERYLAEADSGAWTAYRRRSGLTANR